MTKVCPRCGPKDENEFSFKNKAKGLRSVYCRACQSKYHRDYYERNKSSYVERSRVKQGSIKEYLDELKSETPCADCGNKYPPYVMDFDHRDPSKKSFSVAKFKSTNSVERVLKEIAKCDVVCANCHRERTFGRRLKAGRGTLNPAIVVRSHAPEPT